MTQRVLYISYTGLLDPLGQSQVLQYVLALGQRHNMTLLSFEKPELAVETDKLAALEEQCRAAGVDWIRLPYHRKPGIPATLYDVMMGIRTGRRIAREKGIQIVHCRSYIAGLIGLAVKRATGAKYIFDMRGFWPDERVDGGIWTTSSAPYKVFKRVEKMLFTGADHVVSLTRAGVREFEQFDYLQGRMPPSSVIPTCTNLDMFRPVDTERDGFTLGYVGSAGSWYMFKEVSRAVKILFDKRPDARFLVINKGGHDTVRDHLTTAGVDLSRVDIRAVPFPEVSENIGQMDAGIFFIKPVWSKRASCPTRMGEFLACGKPCLGNTGVGDVAQDLAETGTGLAIDRFDDATLSDAIDQLIDIAAQPDMAERCRNAAEERFSLRAGVDEYDRIYQRSAGGSAPGEEAPLKVLFLTRYPFEGASSRYRVYQYIKHLEAEGVTCDVTSFMDREMYQLSFQPGQTVKKAWATLKATIHRAVKLWHWRKYDIIYMQRELFPFGPPLAERYMKARGGVLFFDYDDALFIKKPSRYNPLATLLRSSDKTFEIFKLVDCVVAGNDWLRDAAIEHGARGVTVEVAEDTDRIAMHPGHSNDRQVTIGWLGSKSTVKYLRFIEPVLKELAAKHDNVRFEIMGGGEFEMGGVPWELHDWSLDGELAALARYDIGLMPLPMEDWAKGKSGGKARTYMAAGVVPVVAAIGYNLELIRDGETGFLCRTEADWETTLSRLIDDPDLRQRVANAARADVEARFAPAGQAAILRDLFDDVLKDARG